MKKILILLIASLFGTVSMLTTGCETLNNIVEDDTVVAKGAVQYATLKFIDKDSVKAAETKARVKEIREDLDTLGEYSTIKNITDLANATIPWDSMSPEDVIGVNTLLALIEAQIDYDISTGVLDSDQLTNVYTILLWVEAAADLYISGVSQEEILGTYKVSEEVVSNDTWPVFYFVTGAAKKHNL